VGVLDCHAPRQAHRRGDAPQGEALTGTVVSRAAAVDLFVDGADGATTMTMAMGDDDDDDGDSAMGNEVDNDGNGATGEGNDDDVVPCSKTIEKKNLIAEKKWELRPKKRKLRWFKKKEKILGENYYGTIHTSWQQHIQ
jgi:hypothetical protein